MSSMEIFLMLRWNLFVSSFFFVTMCTENCISLKNAGQKINNESEWDRWIKWRKEACNQETGTNKRRKSQHLRFISIKLIKWFAKHSLKPLHAKWLYRIESQRHSDSVILRPWFQRMTAKHVRTNVCTNVFEYNINSFNLTKNNSVCINRLEWVIRFCDFLYERKWSNEMLLK